MVGDKISDVLTGRRAGARSILVLTGYGLGEREYRRSRWPTDPDHVAEDLLEAVEWILARSDP
jgi:D-glycero-D-manno-heptose 1,7-bisphosphate phosphatase